MPNIKKYTITLRAVVDLDNEDVDNSSPLNWDSDNLASYLKYLDPNEHFEFITT